MMAVDSTTLGTTLLVITTILGAYLLALRIREYHAEKPDPKLTYTTIKQHQQLQTQLTHYENKTEKTIQNLRLEIKNDHQMRDRLHHRSLEALHQLSRKALQDAAALAAQNKIILGRISELTLKTDKILQQQALLKA